MGRKKYSIFISHAQEDIGLAEAWRRLILAATDECVDAWYSGDPRANMGIPYGEEWRQNVTDRIAASNTVIVLITPVSKERPWVMWETGLAQGSRKKLIPIHYFLNKRNVNSVFQSRQALDGTDQEAVLRACEEIVVDQRGAPVTDQTKLQWQRALIEYKAAVTECRQTSFDRRLFASHFHNNELAETLKGNWFARWTALGPDGNESPFLEDKLFMWTTEDRIRMVGMSRKDGDAPLDEMTEAAHYPMEGVVSSRGWIALSYWSSGKIPICGSVLVSPKGVSGELYEGYWQGYTSRSWDDEPQFTSGRVVMAKNEALLNKLGVARTKAGG